MFSKLAMEITVAAKMGDPDPGQEPAPAAGGEGGEIAVDAKDVIDRAIKKSQAGEGEDYTEIRYEGYGPNGIAIIVEAMTDNLNRTASNVRSYFTKGAAATWVRPGSVSHSFDRVGEISYPASAGDADTVMMAALEAGATTWSRTRRGTGSIARSRTCPTLSDALEKALGESPESRNLSGGRNRAPRSIWTRAEADAADRPA